MNTKITLEKGKPFVAVKSPLDGVGIEITRVADLPLELPEYDGGFGYKQSKKEWYSQALEGLKAYKDSGALPTYIYYRLATLIEHAYGLKVED